MLMRYGMTGNIFCITDIFLTGKGSQTIRRNFSHAVLIKINGSFLGEEVWVTPAVLRTLGSVLRDQSWIYWG